MKQHNEHIPSLTPQRPPTKFHRIWSPFDAPADNYSGSIVGLSSDIFDLRKQSSGLSLLFSLPKAFGLVRYHSPLGPTLPLSSACDPPRACPKTVPNPTRIVITVAIRSSPNIYKTSLFCFLVSLAYLSGAVRLRSEGPNAPIQKPLVI